MVSGGNVWIIPFDALFFMNPVLCHALILFGSTGRIHIGDGFDVFHAEMVKIFSVRDSTPTIHKSMWSLITPMLCPPQLFLENLEHEDSFIYLSAIQGNINGTARPNVMLSLIFMIINLQK